ncbi:Uncharacterised protein [Achromobacter xylosoxidans]|uniref:hypothetical protein n=1 Tax=Alcaligenes xylosoxydans xylosoxydans TaxID=85698 RepID=UPI0006C48F12|nr:hypothetical protein [Achromobacter xylosoxidans]CUI41736.1 Uncharacterised protein [Achromobacter xylosoxidans]CUJ88099.1 Uncharacterised protein [Achromobacter xylosoxidans]
MSASTQHKSFPSLADQLLVRDICSASNALEAHRRFERHATALREWQIIFAEKSDVGSIKLLDLALGAAGVATSVFRGNSLWLMDAPFVLQSGPMHFSGGSAMFVDSNAASYIRAIAYQEDPSPKTLSQANLINQIGTRLQHLNPFLYLWESLRSWNDETVAKCKESVAAIHALSSSGSKLSAEWGRRFRAEFRESAENFATGLIAEFEQEKRAGRFVGMQDQLDLMEAILIRTQIIEISSKKSKEHKLGQLVTYMHEELHTIALRELIVCGDILFRSDRSRIAKKLNSIQNQVDPLALIRNCAWDMYIPRVLDALTAVTPEQAPHVDFYLAEVLSFDGDVSDIINTTKLRAIAVHRPSKMNLPFFDNDVAEWLGNRLAPKRMDSLSDLFQLEAIFDRKRQRNSTSVRCILEADRERLMQLIKKKKG